MKPAAHNSLATLPWHAINWSQPDTTIAQTLGYPHWTVGKYRRLHAPETLPPAPPWESITDWGDRSNADIGRELGIPSKLVAQHRRRCKLPHGPRSPGTGLHKRTGPRKPAPLTMHAKATRLEDVWACLWPDDPCNLQRRDEVAEIQQRTKS